MIVTYANLVEIHWLLSSSTVRDLEILRVGTEDEMYR
jgi:hypothetical protein